MSDRGLAGGYPLLRTFVDPTVPTRPHACHALQELGRRIGVSIAFVDDESDADLAYGGSGSSRSDAAWVPCWPEGYEPAVRHEARTIDGRPCWMPAHRPAEDPVDLVAGTARLLSMTDETCIAADRRAEGGVFGVADLPVERLAVADVPLVEHHAELLRRSLAAVGLTRDERARWPHGKRYAVLLTHDADGPRLQQRAELVKAAAKAVVRRSGPEARAFLAGVSSLVTGSPDPYFGFDDWASIARRVGATSAFYVYVRSGAPRDRHDPLYRIDEHPRWRTLVRLADAGFEIGVHAGIHSCEDPAWLAEERRALEQFLDKPVQGVRHHYWRIDWRDPVETFRRQVKAGYRYDMSIAWRDRPGYRAGTCLPYRPLDPATGEALPLIEIPTGLMDGHLFEYQALSGDAALAEAVRQLETVRSVGGVLNLDWHERASANRFSYAGWRDVLERLVERVATDPEAWFATPRHLADWWSEGTVAG